MKKYFLKYWAVVMGCVMSMGMWAATLKVDLMSETLPTPPEGELGFNKSAPTTDGFKLGSTNYGIWWILDTSTISEASISAWVNSTKTTYTIGYAFSTDKGKTWGETKTVNSDGTKSPSDYPIPKVDIPTGANAIKIVRTAGTSTYACGFTLVTSGSTPTPTTPTIMAFVVSGVQATINQTTKIITATLPFGTDLTSLTPAVRTENATGYQPTGAQNFSTTVVYTAFDGTNKTAYNVDLSVAPASANTDATLSDLKVDGTTVSGFSASNTSYKVVLPTSQTILPVVSATATDSKANIAIAQATSMNGTATVKVTAEDGTTVKNYTVSFSQASTPVTPPTTTLTLHQPEIYETPKPFGGYATPLTVYNGREYEVYYYGKYKPESSDMIGIATSNVFSSGYVVSDSKKSSTDSYEAIDGWFKGTACSVEGGSDGANSAKAEAVEEFKAMPGNVKTYNDTYLELYVKGYDQFRMVAKDNNATESKGKHFEVYIDGIKQSMTLASSPTVRSFNMSLDAHLIKIVGLGGSNNYLYAFSLRTSNLPIVRYVSGNDSAQVVNQTKVLQPITYRMKNKGTFQLTWNGAECTGITLTPNAAGDTAMLSGTVMAPVGHYTYKISALDGNTETASLLGEFDVQTEVRVAKGSSATPTAYINDVMPPVVFEYDALTDADVALKWITNVPAGVTIKKDETANTISMTGTPTTSGSFDFSVVARGGNTIQGSLTVEVPVPVFTAPENEVNKAKATQTMTDVIWKIKYATNATATGLPNGVTGTYKDGEFTLSGKPAAETTYPKTYKYTITATPLYPEKESTTATGTIIVLSPESQSILYLYKGTCDQYVYDYLNTTCDITPRVAANEVKNAEDYDFYDIIIFSESVDATDAEVLDIVKNIDKPILNFKSFTYTINRLDWGVPDNGLAENRSIIVKQPTHPIFSGISKLEVGTTLDLLSAVDTKGIQPIDVTLEGSICVATAPKRTTGDMAVAIHDVPAEVRGIGMYSKYILIPIANRSYKYITETTKKLITNAINYLMGKEQYQAPSLDITSFTVNGTKGTVNQEEATVEVIVPDGTDLSAIKPAIVLSGIGTDVVPTSGAIVDFSHSPVPFTVSDMINQKVYNVTVRTVTALDEVRIAGVSFDGRVIRNAENQWLYVYDMYGRKVTVSNEDIDMEQQPHGVYLIQSAEAVVKIIR